MVLVLTAAVVYLLSWHKERTQRRALHLVSDAQGNEALIVSAKLDGESTFFLIDTAYAGAPVLSTTFLSVQHRCCSRRHGSVSEQYRACTHLMNTERIDDDARHAAMRGLLARGGCRAFVSGCTMRLMGIAETKESRADLILCPSLGNDGSSTGDVLVSHSLPGTPHILTTDYLLHRAPCVVRPGAGELRFRASVEAHGRGFEMHSPARFVGGAFVVPLRVGGADMQIVVDTGAAAALSLSASAVERLETCDASGQRAFQSGVNGERVCSDVLYARVRVLKTLDVGVVPIYANSEEVQGADGYMGMGLLRALDLWLQPDAIGFRSSGLAVGRQATSTSEGTCRSKPPTCTRRE